MQKTTIQGHSTLALIFANIMARLHAMLDAAAPVGYQDENGFHLGVERAGKK